MRARPLITTTAIALPVIVVVLLVTRPGPEAQAEALFADLSEELTSGSAGAVVDMLAEEYDIRAHWPDFGYLDQLWSQAERRVAANPGADPQPYFRKEVASALGLYLGRMRLRGDLRVEAEVHEVIPRDDGSFDAIVSLSTQDLSPSVEFQRHRFNLVSRGWLRPEAKIRDHDPIAVQ